MRSFIRAALIGMLSLSAGLQAAAAQDPPASDGPPPKAKSTADRPAGGTSKTEKSARARGKSKASPSSPAALEKATFGGGCFWCLEAVFERVPGVKSAVSGYAGSDFPHPTYDLVQTGETGHAEVVQVTFDPAVVSFDELLDIFWHAHDPTSLNRQGPDEGTEYRSIILYHSEAQQESARKSYAKLTASGAFGDPIVTELVPLTRFYPAESYHQDYFRKHRNAAYCQMYIVPKLRKFAPKLREMEGKAKGAEAGR
jgi:peptide-methionine (S)-S-oxide reductase